VASLLILVGLAGIAMAVYVKGRSRPAGLPTVPEPTAALRLPARLLDSLTQISRRRYTPENLYEYINGQAPRFIQFGFRGLLVAEYGRNGAAAPEIVVDLYDMSARRNAYGMFHDLRPVEEEPLAVGNEGFASGNVAGFWKGNFYVRVSAPTEEDASDRVRQAAEEVASAIPDQSRRLAEFDAFPQDGLVAGSLAFHKSAAFGLEHLHDVFSAEYATDGMHYRLFFSDPGGRDKADEMLRRHEAFLASQGRVEVLRRTDAEAVLWGSQKYLGHILLMQRGGLVAGCIGLADRGQAERVTRDLLRRALAATVKGPTG